MKNWCLTLFIIGAMASLTACGGGEDSSSGGGGGSSSSGTPADGWSDAKTIDSGNSNGDPNRPEVALDSSDNVIAVWYENGMNAGIWANHYTPSIGWGAAVNIDAGDGGFVPKVAFDSNGNAIAVWHTYGDTYANLYNASTGWDTPVVIGSGGGSFPHIAFDSSGNAIAVWYQTDGFFNSIYANRYTAGTGWGTEELIETENDGGALYPRIAFDGSGNAISVWEYYDGTRNNIWSNYYTVGTGWGTAVPAETAEGNAAAPKIAIDVSGNAIAVWIQHDGTAYSIWANRYTAATGWGTATVIETATGDAAAPRISFDGSGNAISVWSQDEGSFTNIRSNRYIAGVGWGTAESLETGNATNAPSPQLTVDNSGNAIAVWEHYDGTRMRIWASRYTAGAGWGTPGAIEPDNGGGAYEPQVAVDGNGKAMAVWKQWDGTQTRVWASRYE